jgi:hypothetical protein
VAKTADELIETYQRAVTELVSLFTRVIQVDKEVDRVNGTPGCQRQLRKVELTARDITEFHQTDVSVLAKCVLPPLIFGHGAAVNSWPPPTPNIGLQYYEMVLAGLRGAPPPLTNQQRIEASQRQMAFVAEQERGRERLNAEATTRADAHEAERRRLAAGG